jgi:hypothetical protein
MFRTVLRYWDGIKILPLLIRSILGDKNASNEFDMHMDILELKHGWRY